MATLTLTTVTLDTPDPARLATFYGKLLGREPRLLDPTWCTLPDPDGGVGLAFALAEPYVPPVWPNRADAQQMQLHLEVKVDDLDAALAHAKECGARLHEHQPQESVRVCVDPDGHPFCLWVDEG